MKTTLKTILASTLIFASMTAFAHEGGEFGTIYCIQNRQFSPIKNNTSNFVVMQQLSKDPKNNRYYSLSLFQKNLGTGQRTLVLQDKVKVTTEDVMVHLRGIKGARGEKTLVSIFLDELNQSSIEGIINGQKFDISLICRPNAEGLKLVQSN